MKKASTLFIRNAYKPECLQCAYFSPPCILDVQLSPKQTSTLSTHILYERSICGKVSDKNVVTGEIRPILAKYARIDDELCGENGRFFIHRNPDKARWAISAGNIKAPERVLRPMDEALNDALNNFLYKK